MLHDLAIMAWVLVVLWVAFGGLGKARAPQDDI